jgi:DNA polymerase-3 subunit epsilon
VPNVKLQTLATYFRTRTKPIHRALEDAEATGEVLQVCSTSVSTSAS